ncbi:MAG: hypothetical protein IJ461_03920, partial [Clostridia bacterium]|nr:hypothetical protein [Clostridia bacterium]
MAQRLLPLAIMALGLMGHGLALRGFFHVTCEFVPAILGSCVIVWVTAGGMLGFLDAAVWSFNGLGVLMLLCVGLKKRFRRNSDRRFPMALGLLLFLGILLAVYLNDKKLTHYDNFSHWGTIVKSMVLERALPGRDSSLITFQSYPPGSAVFIYYILQGIGWSESHALIAQGLLIISFALALLAGMPQQKKLLWLAVFLGFSLFLCFNYVTIHDLLVDALLACCGLACSIYIMTSYSKRGANAWLAVMLCACYLIKNSGLFYVAINTALLFVCVLRQGDSAKRIKNIVRCSLVAVMPWLMLLLWSA